MSNYYKERPSKSDESLKVKKIKKKNHDHRHKTHKKHEGQSKENENFHDVSRNPSSDSVIYVGTFYYSWPIIDLTKSESNLSNNADKQSNSLIENNVPHGDSSSIGTNLSVITIRPASVDSLISSASENTIYNDSRHKIEANDNILKNLLLADTSRSDLKLHHSYPLNQDLQLKLNQSVIFNNNNNNKTNSGIIQTATSPQEDLGVAKLGDTLQNKSGDSMEDDENNRDNTQCDADRNGDDIANNGSGVANNEDSIDVNEGGDGVNEEADANNEVDNDNMNGDVDSIHGDIDNIHGDIDDIHKNEDDININEVDVDMKENNFVDFDGDVDMQKDNVNNERFDGEAANSNHDGDIDKNTNHGSEEQISPPNNNNSNNANGNNSTGSYSSLAGFQFTFNY